MTCIASTCIYVNQLCRLKLAYLYLIKYHPMQYSYLIVDDIHIKMIHFLQFCVHTLVHIFLLSNLNSFITTGVGTTGVGRVRVPLNIRTRRLSPPEKQHWYWYSILYTHSPSSKFASTETNLDFLGPNRPARRFTVNRGCTRCMRVILDFR